MTMEQANEKYKRALEVLKRNTPVLNSPDDITEKVLSRLSGKYKQEKERFDLVEFFFGWTYINWVRRSLVAVSVFLAVMFVFQQSIIMKQINNLSRQIDYNGKGATAITGDLPDSRLMLFSIPGRRLQILRKFNSDKQVEDLFRSIDQLQKEYKSLHKIIEEDPGLKKLIEKRLSEISDSKVKL